MFVPDGDNPDRTKHCPDCGRDLPVGAFHRNARQSDGLAFYCKACARTRSEASRRKRGIAPKKESPVPIPEGYKWCPDCGEIKSVKFFPRTQARVSGRHSYCKPCHIKRGVVSREGSGGTREYHLRRRYGLTEVEFREMLRSQGDVCAICREPDPRHVDHDHITGAVRGILCFNCNGGLGQFKDDVDRLSNAVSYLKGLQWRWVLIHPGVYQRTLPALVRPPSPTS